ncbi:MAG: hypothetical protein H7838_02095, partial [Magnetococcus sp. DMHC-8]
RDPVEAAHWLLAAARQGEPRSQHTLGALCYEGLGVAQDDGQALFWLTLSAANTPDALQPHLQAILAEVTSRLSPAEQEGIHKQVALWQPQVQV